MKKVKVKQGTRLWENLKEERIGSSEVFDIVRYYATNQELLNCGLDPEKFKNEIPFVSTWALYHKLIKDNVYKKPLLGPEFGEYGLAMEQYGLKKLQENRNLKLKKGEVYISENLIASLDISGIAEEIDIEHIKNVKLGDKFVCEQKTITPYKDSLPLKYVIQAQYQITMSKKKFYILQAMILKEDTPFERGKIVSLSNTNKKKFFEYLKDKVDVQLIYFESNETLSQLIKTCLDRFFKDVEDKNEPTPFLASDNLSNIIIGIRQNSFYNPSMIKEFNLSKYAEAKKKCEEAETIKREAMQEIIDFARLNNCSRFVDTDYTASFSANGRFLLKERYHDIT